MDREKWEALLRQKEKRADACRDGAQADGLEADGIREMEFARDGRRFMAGCICRIPCP